MPETPVERQTITDQHRGEQLGSAEAEANSHKPRSRSLEVGGQFVKALAADLGAIASRFRPRSRPPQPPSARTSSGPGIGRVFWRVGMVFLGVVLLCSGALSAAMLWVIFGSPLDRHSNPNAPALRAEATNDTSPSRGGTVDAAGPSRPNVGPSAEASIPPAPSPAAAAQPEKPAEQANAGAQPAANQSQPVQTATQPAPTPPQPVQTAAQPTSPQPAQTAAQNAGPGAGQPETSGKSTDQHAGMQCAADLCAATYKSFNAADCTYQPYGGGQRSICELNAQSAAAHSQPSPSPAATDSSPTATDTQPATAMQSIAKAAAPDRAGPQCNRSRCAATYQSFHAADCTCQPEGGGPRQICEP
jgi:BA14K-like protein